MLVAVVCAMLLVVVFAVFFLYDGAKTQESNIESDSDEELSPNEVLVALNKSLRNSPDRVFATLDQPEPRRRSVLYFYE